MVVRQIAVEDRQYQKEFMTKEKYYDWSGGRMLDPQKDGCDYKEWAVKFEAFPFAVHPKGFLVFLPPGELDASDEYKESDPYKMMSGLETDFHQRRIQCTLELIKSVVPEKGKDVEVLDLGCGQGHVTARIKQAFPMTNVSGLDYSISAIGYAAEAFNDIDFIVGNALDPPYSEGYFDVIICNNLWEHVPYPLLLLERIRRIMKVGGHLVISTPSRYRMDNLIRMLRGKPVTLMSKLHVTEYSVGQVIEQLEFGRFEVIRTYSKPTKPGSLLYRLAMSIVRLFLKIIRSHHNLESTVFFLARKCA